MNKTEQSASSECDTVIFIGTNSKRNYLKNNRSSNTLTTTNESIRLTNKPRPKLGVFSTYYNRKSNHQRSSSSSASNFSSSSSSMNSSNTKPTEIWIDGPKNTTQQHQQMRQLATKILTPSLNDIKLNEIWIDGPKMNPANLINCDSFDSLECLDRQLLRQLNEHDMDIHDTIHFKLNSDSRPISLLSVNSTDTANSLSLFSNSTNKNSENDKPLQPNEANISYKQKLEDLKQSYDQMIFKQSYKEMESLHKTLESFLSLDQTSKLKMIMKPIKSTTLTSANDLNKQQFNESKRVLSPSRFRPAPQIETSVGEASSSSSSSSVLSSSPSSPNSCNQPLYAIPVLKPHKHLTSSPILATKRSTLHPMSFDYFDNSKEVSHYSEPFDNLNRTIDMNLNNIFNQSQNNLLVVKNINKNRSNRVSKNENNRLCYNFTNQNQPRLNQPIVNFTVDHLRLSPADDNRLTKIDLNTSISVPSTPNHMRKASTKLNLIQTQSFKENKKLETKPKESILNRIFNRSKSNSKTTQLDTVKPSKINDSTNDSISRSSSNQSRVKGCFPATISSNTSSGYDSPGPSLRDLDKSSAKCTFNNSIIGGADLLSSSGYDSLSKENTNNDDSSDCITTASSLSADLKYSTLSRLKSGKS